MSNEFSSDLDLVLLPESAQTAEAYVRHGLNWLRVNDPERLQQTLKDDLVFEAALEAAFWEYDARHKGDGQFREMPQSQRLAFKSAVRGLIATMQGHPKT